MNLSKFFAVAILPLAIFFTSSFALAAQIVLTDEADIIEFLAKNPEATAYPLALSLTVGSMVQVISVSYSSEVCRGTDSNETYKVTLKTQGAASGEHKVLISCPKKSW